MQVPQLILAQLAELSVNAN